MAKRKKARVVNRPEVEPIFVNGMWLFEYTILSTEFRKEKPKKRKKRKHPKSCLCLKCEDARYGIDEDELDEMDQEYERLQNRINRLESQNQVLRHQLREELRELQRLHRDSNDGAYWQCAQCANINRMSHRR